MQSALHCFQSHFWWCIWRTPLHVMGLIVVDPSLSCSLPNATAKQQRTPSRSKRIFIHVPRLQWWWCGMDGRRHKVHFIFYTYFHYLFNWDDELYLKKELYSIFVFRVGGGYCTFLLMCFFFVEISISEGMCCIVLGVQWGLVSVLVGSGLW